MNIEDDLRKWQKLPPQLRAGQVLTMARKLGLGMKRVQGWMAHEATRGKRPGYEQWSYPRDETLCALLDMAGVSVTVGARTLAGGSNGKTAEGAPGSNNRS
ncbi:MAG: hypothetical protein ACYC67_27340 [Prosthecobacter sp.]